VADRLAAWLLHRGLGPAAALAVTVLLALAATVCLAVLLTWLTRQTLLRFIHRSIRRTAFQWDDRLMAHHVFERMAYFVPVLVLHLARDLFLPLDHRFAELLNRLISCGFVAVTMWSVSALLGAASDIYDQARGRSGFSLRVYLDIVRIGVYVLGLVFLLSILTGKSPWGLVSLLTGLTAVLLLVFRDWILGFAAGLQLLGNDQIRLGDWIEVPKYQADGEVLDISVHGVRVRNWDKTITTIPTHGLVSSGFKNWRGMQQSGGRRIKRSIHIDMRSIRFVGEEELARFRRIERLRPYLEAKAQEIAEYNRTHGVDDGLPVNGRCQTNIGLFRAYVVAYLRAHPMIHQEMTFLVRHLKPGPTGLPLEIYVFSRDQVWANYEAIQADIFDHLLAALEYFDLRAFQYPSGHDLARWIDSGAAAPDGGAS